MATAGKEIVAVTRSRGPLLSSSGSCLRNSGPAYITSTLSFSFLLYRLHADHFAHLVSCGRSAYLEAWTQCLFIHNVGLEGKSLFNRSNHDLSTSRGVS
jgi:hypothetical protein